MLHSSGAITDGTTRIAERASAIHGSPESWRVPPGGTACRCGPNLPQAGCTVSADVVREVRRRCRGSSIRWSWAHHVEHVPRTVRSAARRRVSRM